MDRGSNILFIIACIAIVFSISSLFYKTMIIEDFEILVAESDTEEGEME